MPEPETEATLAITYRELYRRVNEFAALLRDWVWLARLVLDRAQAWARECVEFGRDLHRF